MLPKKKRCLNIIWNKDWVCRRPSEESRSPLKIQSMLCKSLITKLVRSWTNCRMWLWPSVANKFHRSERSLQLTGRANKKKTREMGWIHVYFMAEMTSYFFPWIEMESVIFIYCLKGFIIYFTFLDAQEVICM